MDRVTVTVRLSVDDFRRHAEVCRAMGADTPVTGLFRMLNMHSRAYCHAHRGNEMVLRKGGTEVPASPVKQEVELRLLRPEGSVAGPAKGAKPEIVEFGLQFIIVAEKYDEILRFGRWTGITGADADVVEELAYRSIQYAEKVTKYREDGWDLVMVNRNTRRRENLNWMYDPEGRGHLGADQPDPGR